MLQQPLLLQANRDSSTVWGGVWGVWGGVGLGGDGWMKMEKRERER